MLHVLTQHRDKDETIIHADHDLPLHKWLTFCHAFQMPGTPEVRRILHGFDSDVFVVARITPFTKDVAPPSDLIVPLHMHYSYVAKLGREYPATDSAKALDEFMKYDGRWSPIIGIEAFALNEARRLILWNPVGINKGVPTQ